MKCPICEDTNIELNSESTGAKLNSETNYYECTRCRCAFGNDGEIIENWSYCADCLEYVAPEDRPRPFEAICIPCLV